MKLTFMTLGCPKWDLGTICKRGREYGFQGVDFRGYLETLDITMLPMFTSHAANTLRLLNDAGLEVSAISSSIQVCVEEKKEDNLEEARRTIEVSHKLNNQNVRIFGGGNPDTHSQHELAAIGRDCIEAILELDGASDMHWLFETHDLWVRAGDCRLLLDSIPHPAFGVIWDMGHTYRVGKEKPTETYAVVKDRIGYTHIKDAVYDPQNELAMDDGWYYVFPGTGELPLAESIKLIKSGGYNGWLQFEHEKRWHPNLPEPEIAFPAFVKWARTVI